MMKKIVSLCLVLLFTAFPALAEVFTGSTVARNPQSITADAGGIIEELLVQPGSAVKQGEPIARLRTTKVFASQNGTVARIHASEGKETEGTILEIAPVSRYTIHCTSDGAYDSISTNLVHCGESLYLYCTKNGTHQGRGLVYSIDGETYMVEATAGEFYVGETVYLYRDQDYSKKQRVGIGTVVSAATEAYKSEGRIAAIHVTEGEYVEKGELLYEVIDGETTEIVAPADGIITSCEAENGANVASGQSVAALAAYVDICIAVQVEESLIEQLSPGNPASVCYLSDVQERQIPGMVIEISTLAQDGYYTAYVAPSEPPAQLGLSAEVQIG